MIRLRLLLVPFACLLVLAPAAAAKPSKRPPVGPGQGVIVKLLKEHYLGDDPSNYPSATYAYKVGSIARGAARLGNHFADGTPPNTRTTVFPVHAISTRTVEYDGSRTVTKFDAKYVFFRGEFHEWTFAIKGEHSTISH